MAVGVACSGRSSPSSRSPIGTLRGPRVDAGDVGRADATATPPRGCRPCDSCASRRPCRRWCRRSASPRRRRWSASSSPRSRPGSRGGDRPVDHRVRPAGDVRSGQGLHGGVRRGRARPRDGRPGGRRRPPVMHNRVRRRRRDDRPGGDRHGHRRDGSTRGRDRARRQQGVQRRQRTVRSRRSSTSTSPSRAGEFVSLIGPSGCGKSTLLRLVANLIEPSVGDGVVNGKPAAGARLDQDYGMAFQQAGLFDWRTVARNVELPLELKGWDKRRRRAAGARDARARQARATSPSTGRGSCRAACSSASPSPGPWRPTRRCC